MEITVQTKNLDLSDDIRSYAERKISRLGRYLPAIEAATVELTREAAKSAQNRVVAQATLDCPGAILRAEERAPDVYRAIDAVADVLKRQVDRFKGKLYWKGRVAATIPAGGVAIQTAEAVAEAEAESPSTGELVKVKRFALKPMAPDEAVEHMALLGHSFFLFRDAESGLFSVVYQRRDGDYGLIQAEGS
ncbi:MAG: ribosome-associated translation inhibitor RaiA [Chloroflexi bacterium]|nr:ribosome-associated translation inhibitor RaiA [Chloroflexota bacterium]